MIPVKITAVALISVLVGGCELPGHDKPDQDSNTCTDAAIQAGACNPFRARSGPETEEL